MRQEYTQQFWRETLEHAPDLERVKTATIREQVIRQAMKETGEPREIVAEQFDASVSMNHEVVLDLTDGEPASLADSLSRYIDVAESYSGTVEWAQVANELHAILSYPYPQEGSVQ